ncbi:MAG: hypothetical protein ATN31_08050 [Candidatus Epulonipiscioides saccharophilum]|nr:MAG: hypothetical protein ATN31_08050 [Epulopiscium sp. AS2M-Bin001]
MKIKKFVYLTLVFGMLTGCSAEEQTTEVNSEKIETTIPEEKEEVKEPEVVEESARDLGGMKITIGSWTDVIEPEIKASAQEEALWEYRNEMMEKHNFTIEQKAVAKWNGTLELMSTSTMAGDPAAHVFHLFTTFVPTAINSNLCYDLATLDSIDLNSDKWDSIVEEVTSRGDSTYGIFPLQQPTIGIFFNKRLFEDVGLDGDLLYDLQASGEWTWENFEEICDKLTRDLDSDGINDVYAINSLPNRFYMIAPLSNDARYISFEDEKFVGQYNNKETVEAFEWVTEFLSGSYDLYPENWKGQEELFTSGKVAMYIGDHHNVMQFQEMEDDFGFVTFPKGPNAKTNSFSSVADCWLIPNTFSKEEAENIAFALDIWSNPAPGYDGAEDWKLSEYKLFRDERAVDETLALARKDGVRKFDYHFAMSGFDLAAFYNPLTRNGMSVSEGLESVQGIWDAAINKANGEQ